MFRRRPESTEELCVSSRRNSLLTTLDEVQSSKHSEADADVLALAVHVLERVGEGHLRLLRSGIVDGVLHSIAVLAHQSVGGVDHGVVGMMHDGMSSRVNGLRGGHLAPAKPLTPPARTLLLGGFPTPTCRR
jgi:hypothetical protein